MKIELIDVLPDPIPEKAGIESEVWMGTWVLDSGKRHLVSGVSGRGKSTLLQILSGIRTDFAGNLALNGKDSQNIPQEEWANIRAEKVSLLFQDLRLFPELTALENVHLIPALSKDREDIETMSKRLGINELMDKKCSLLSQGQRQRVAISQALVSRPSIMRAGEPTGNLDSKSGSEVMGILDDLHRNGNTIILVTHEDDVAQHAHRIIRLFDGKIIEDSKQAP